MDLKLKRKKSRVMLKSYHSSKLPVKLDPD